DEAVDLRIGHGIEGILPVVPEFGQAHDSAISRTLAPIVAAQESRSAQPHFLNDEQRFRRQLPLGSQTKAEVVTDRAGPLGPSVQARKGTVGVAARGQWISRFRRAQNAKTSGQGSTRPQPSTAELGVAI